MAGFRQRGADVVELQAVPHPAVTIGVDLSNEPFEIDDLSGRRQRGSVVAGLALGGARVRGRDLDCLQVRLSPAVAHAVLGSSPEMCKNVIALQDVWGQDARRIEEQLRAALSWQDRFAIAEAALARRCETGPAVDPEVAYAWSQMQASRGGIRMERLAAEVGWSRKRFWSRFGSQVGLSPKRAAQLVRFDHAAHRLAAGHNVARVAAETGYADQSHLHREAMAFAGVTPSVLAVAPWLAVDDVAWASPADAPSRGTHH